MSLIKYEILNAVVEYGSLTRASEALNITQSAVSHAIASLESEYGFSLLHRSRSGVRVTAEGERILGYTREIMRWTERMKQEISLIRGAEIGTVRIGTFASVSTQWLPGILKQFRLSHPGIEIKLWEGDYAEIEHWLASGAIDLGFLSLSDTSPFETISLQKDRMMCILPLDHPLASEKSVTFERLLEQPFILPKWGGDNEIERLIRQHNAKLNVVYEVAEDQAIMAMVRNGLGISLLPEMVLQNHTDSLALVPLEGDPYRKIGLACASLRNLSPASRRFIEEVEQWLHSPKTPG
ncbi:LysR family transcriptional regulator [Paenibacillus barcinonensis]|uniref:DNA-binding transcriptional LysR family regulator n=1 Tax=Paenibacillus barcinonensis TaxID=198119 RepID=A0A2V4VXJ9_PAEBA|nr:LysR family transcriptional regulator [Paenibacillus barcinonensis]PYE50099.1 DNA-binding transcriptional LysR family regulator [Paenibacillus barcinonensis]QKS59836.1 LysR family transcriptional regulator [Paenibacillus barcinonensis]